jgi:hypothetical protein
MSKSEGECFLCGEEGKGKRFTFYSGERKGGSRTELLSATVTVSEWWNDLRMHEAHVCRECQERLWAEHVKWPPILCGIGAAVLLVLAAPIAILGGRVGLAIAAVLVVAALAVGGAAVWFYTQGKRPQRARIEQLVVREAAGQFPDDGRTYLTNEKYLDLVDRGVIG